MAFPTQQMMVASRATLADAASNADMTQRILAQVEQIADPFAERNRTYEQIDECIFLEQAVIIPDTYQDSAVEVRSPLPMHIVNTVTAALSVNPPTVQFDKIGRGDVGEENVALRQHGFESSWARQEQEADRELFRIFTHSVTTKGEGIMKTMERKKVAWGGYNEMSKAYLAELANTNLDQGSKDKLYSMKTEEYKRMCPYPIYTTDVPPETFFYVRNEFGMTTACEVKDVPYFDTLARYGMGLTKKGELCPAAIGMPMGDWSSIMYDSGTPMLRCIELWNTGYQQIILQAPGDLPKDGEQNSLGSGYIVKQTKHNYGDKYTQTLRGPYFHCFGITTSSREIGKQGLSVLAPFLHLFPLLNSLLTIQGQAAFNFGYPAFKRTKPPELGIPDTDFGIDPEEATGTEEEIIPGHIYPYDIAPIDQPRTSIDVDKTIAMVRGLIDLALPSVVQGQLNAGDAGYAINQAAHMAKLAWDPLIKNEQRALSRRTGFESWLIENNIKEGVQVYGTLPGYMQGKGKATEGWLSIKPEDLNGVHNYKVILQPETPTNEALEVRLHSDKLKLKVETPDDAIRALGGDPVAVKRGWMKYEIENDPALKGLQRQRIMKRITAQTQEAMAGVRNAQPPQGGGAIAPPQQQQMLAPPPGMPNPAGPPQPMGPGGPPAMTPPQMRPIQTVGVPGTPVGAPGGIRNMPPQHMPLPGEGTAP